MTRPTPTARPFSFAAAATMILLGALVGSPPTARGQEPGPPDATPPAPSVPDGAAPTTEPDGPEPDGPEPDGPEPDEPLVEVPDEPPPPAIAALLEGLGAASWAERERAQADLVRIGDDALPYVRAVAAKTEDAEVRGRARDVESLIVFGVRHRDRQRLATLVEETPPSQWNQLRGWFSRSGDSVLPYLLRRLEAGEVDRGVQFKLLDAIGWTGSRRATPLVLELLGRHEPDPQLLQKLVDTLGQLRDPEAVEPLVGLLRRHQDNATLAGKIASALSATGDARGAPALIELARSELDRERRGYSYPLQQALYALGSLRHDDAFEVLEQASRDGEPSVRIASVVSIARARFDGALPVVRRALRDEDVSVRRSAVSALGTIGGDEVVEDILSAWNEEDRYVRYAVLVALRSVNDARRLRIVGAAAVDADGLLRDEGVRILEELRDPRTIEVLIDALAAAPSPDKVITALETVAREVGPDADDAPRGGADGQPTDPESWRSWWGDAHARFPRQVRPLGEPKGRSAGLAVGGPLGATGARSPD